MEPSSDRRPILARPRVAWPVAAVAAVANSQALAAQRFADEGVPLPTPDPDTNAPTRLVTGDLDGDGWDELVAQLTLNDDHILRGSPDELTYVGSVDGSDSNSAVIADLDGDGRGDYVTQNFTQLGWYPGEAGASLGAFQPLFDAGDATWKNAAADFDADGVLDVVVSTADGGSGFVRLFLAPGGGSSPPSYQVLLAQAPSDLALGDFNADGDLDVACAFNPVGPAVVLLGQARASCLRSRWRSQAPRLGESRRATSTRTASPTSCARRVNPSPP